MRRQIIVIAVGLLLISHQTFAYLCAQSLGFCYNGVSQINLVPNGSQASSLIDDAVSYWSNSCNGTYGADTPSLANSPTETGIAFNVYYVDGPSTVSDDPQACGVTDLYNDPATGNIEGGQIIVFSQTSTGQQCQNPLFIINHEVGHALGLADVTDPACADTLMYKGSVNLGLASGSCETIDDVWYTPQEQQRDSDCTSTCRGACYDGRCGADECFQIPGGGYTESCYSPIVLDIAGHGYHITDAQHGVAFDLNADGTREFLSWPQNGDNGFLCLDRNGNGEIDTGRELFGNYTPLSNGHFAHNGFAALAEYDSPALGGNGNRSIDPGDAIWELLRVWRDSNHDGVSEPDELTTLAAAGITSISIDYAPATRVDDYGNAYRYKGKFTMLKNGKPQTHDIYDIFFVPRH